MNVDTERLPSRSGYLAALILLGALASTWPSWWALADVWRSSETYTHGWLVAVVCVGWLWSRMKRLPVESRAPVIAWAFFVGASLVWPVAFRAQSVTGEQAAAVSVVFGALWAALGTRAMRHLALPIGFFIFALPVWSLLVPLLQSLAVNVVEVGLRLLGVPAVIEGVIIQLQAGSFSVDKGCSGVHYLIIATATAVAAASWGEIRGRRAVLLVLLAAGLALVTNWLRIWIVVVAGYLTHMQHYFIVHEHKSLGYVLSVVLLATVVLFARRLAGSEPAASTEAPREVLEAIDTRRSPPYAVAALVLTVLAIGLIAWVSPPQAGPTMAREILLPKGSGRWSGPESTQSAWHPTFVGVTSEVRGRYVSGGDVTDVYVGEYASQERGRELISYDNRLANEDWYAISDARLDEHGSASNAGVSVFRTNGEGHWAVAYVYEVGPLRTTYRPLAQVAYGLLSWWQVTPGRVIAVGYRCHDSCSEASAVLRDFSAAVPVWQLSSASN